MKKPVQPVEKPKPVSETNAETLRKESEAQAIREQQKENTEEFKEPSIQDIIGSVDPEKVKMAEDLGIPLKAIINYMAFQEEKLNLVIEHMPKKEDMAEAFQQGLKTLTAPQPNMTPGQPMPQGQASGLMGQLSQLAPILPYLTGGGEDNTRKQIMDNLLALQVKKMETDIGFTDAIKNALVSRLVGKAVSKIDL